MLQAVRLEPRRADIELCLGKMFPEGIRRVLLITPPDSETSVFREDTARRLRYPNYPPYGLGVVAQKLKDIGVEVKITNLNHFILKRCIEAKEGFYYDLEWRSKLELDLFTFKPDLVGITCMFTMTHGSFKKVCELVKNSGFKVAVGGVHVTNDAERVLDDIPSIDMAFLNEAELSIQKMVKVVNGKSSVKELGGMILVDGSTRFRPNADCKPQDVNVIPAYDLLPMKEMSNYGTVGAFYCFKPNGTKFATVLSNRGCRAQCTFCSVRTFNGMGVRQRSIASVIEELERLKDLGVGHIMWLDDDLLKDHSRAIGLFNEMVKRNLGMTWDATNGLIAHSCQPEVVQAMSDSGCIAVNIGMESGNPGILKQIRKPGTVDSFLRAAEVFRKFENIHACVLLMLGFPGETLGMIQDTVNVALEMDLDWHRIVQLQPLPNTPIYDSMVAQGLIEPVGSKNVRFTGGAFGKQVEIEQGRQLTTPHFKEAFGQIKLDQIPTSEQLIDVWFYMNYHLNFHRLFSESRQVKIDQQFKMLRILSDVISPENGFALYFLAYLQRKRFGKTEEGLVERLEKRLETSSYWKDRLQAFNLSVEDLKGTNGPWN